jgi:hypothetical protein
MRQNPSTHNILLCATTTALFALPMMNQAIASSANAVRAALLSALPLNSMVTDPDVRKPEKKMTIEEIRERIDDEFHELIFLQKSFSTDIVAGDFHSEEASDAIDDSEIQYSTRVSDDRKMVKITFDFGYADNVQDQPTLQLLEKLKKLSGEVANQFAIIWVNDVENQEE